MQSIEMKSNDRAVAHIIKATFPNYRKRKVYLRAPESVTLCDLNWSGGTRSEYRTCTLDGKPVSSSLKYSQLAPWDNPAEGVTLPIPQGFVCVRGGHFCGKESTLSIMINPADMPKYLPASQSEEEREYNRDLALRLRDGQVGSGMKHR